MSVEFSTVCKSEGGEYCRFALCKKRDAMSWYGNWELADRIYSYVAPDPVGMPSALAPWIEREIEDSNATRSQIRRTRCTLISVDEEDRAEKSLMRIAGVSLAMERLLLNGKLISTFMRRVLKKRGCLQTIRLVESKHSRPAERTVDVCASERADYLCMVFSDRLVAFRVHRMEFDTLVEQTLMHKLVVAIHSAVASAPLSHDRHGVTQMQVNTLDIIKEIAPEAVNEAGGIERTQKVMWLYKRISDWIFESPYIAEATDTVSGCISTRSQIAQVGGQDIAESTGAMRLGQTFFVQPIDLVIRFVHAFPVECTHSLADEIVAMLAAQKEAEKVHSCLCRYKPHAPYDSPERLKNAFKSMSTLDETHKKCVLQILETHTNLKDVMSAYLDKQFATSVSLLHGCRMRHTTAQRG